MIVLDTNVALNGATTQYSDFEMNSMVKFGNEFLCAGPSGLFKLDGTTKMFSTNPNTENNITSFFEPVTMDFGISSQKRLRSVYFGYEAEGNITLTISTELSSAQEYILPATELKQHARKVNINRSLKGRYWTFQVSGDNVYFAIDSIQVLPIVRSHGFDQN